MVGGGVQSFLDPPPKIYWVTSTKFYIYRDLQLKHSRLTPFLRNLGKRGGLWTCPKVRGTRAWVQATGRVKPMKQQFTPNLQDCASMG